MYLFSFIFANAFIFYRSFLCFVFGAFTSKLINDDNMTTVNFISNCACLVWRKRHENTELKSCAATFGDRYYFNLFWACNLQRRNSSEPVDINLEMRTCFGFFFFFFSFAALVYWICCFDFHWKIKKKKNEMMNATWSLINSSFHFLFIAKFPCPENFKCFAYYFVCTTKM